MFFGGFRLGFVGVDDFPAGFSGPLGVCFWIFEPVGFVCLTSLSEIRGLDLGKCLYATKSCSCAGPHLP